MTETTGPAYDYVDHKFDCVVIGAGGAGLRATLESHGWKADLSEQGDILLWPPSMEPESDTVSLASEEQATPSPEPQVLGYEVLRTTLESHGWRVGTDHVKGRIRRKIRLTICISGRDPANGAWNNRAGHQFIDRFPGDRRGVEFHIKILHRSSF